MLNIVIRYSWFKHHRKFKRVCVIVLVPPGLYIYMYVYIYYMYIYSHTCMNTYMCTCMHEYLNENVDLVNTLIYLYLYILQWMDLYRKNDVYFSRGLLRNIVDMCYYRNDIYGMLETVYAAIDEDKIYAETSKGKNTYICIYVCT
jgi:hypothetical protein